MKQKTQNLIEVSYSSNTTYLTHNYHPYPCKFVPQIPQQIISKYSKEGDLILDPFCGSGTTLTEASLLNRNAVGIDINPVGALSAKVKTTTLSKSDKQVAIKLLDKIACKTSSSFEKFVESNFEEKFVPDFDNLNHWFLPFVIKELAVLKKLILEVKNSKARNFLLVAFSNVIVSISKQDSETRYVAVKKDTKKHQLFAMFSKKVGQMLQRNDEYAKQRSKSKISVFHADSRRMPQVSDSSVNLILTSPPYLNTFDYYLYHKLRIVWLGFSPKTMRDLEMGCHHTSSKYVTGFGRYKQDLSDIFAEFHRVLTKDGKVCLIIGDAQVEKRRIDILSLVKELAIQHKFEIEDVISQKLKKATRSFNAKFSTSGKNEYMLLMHKI